MDGQDHQPQTLEQEWTTTGWGRLDEKKMEIDQAYTEMEPAGQKKKRKASKHLEEGSEGDIGCTECSWRQIERTAQDIGRSKIPW